MQIVNGSIVKDNKVFRRDVQQVKNLILQVLREQGLETPLQQKRLVEAWPEVAGPVIAQYTLNTYIYNQTLYVRLSNPALRADLSMQQVITDVRFG